MKKLYLLFLMGGFLGSFQGVAQQLKINQSQQIKDLMEVKKEFSRQEKTYQIQVYNGNVTEANEHVKRATSKFPYRTTKFVWGYFAPAWKQKKR